MSHRLSACHRAAMSSCTRYRVLVALWLGLGMTACDRAAELETALEARRGEWNRGVAAIRLRQSATMGRFNALAPPAANSGGYAQHARTRVVVLSAHQSLSDLENAAIQAGRQIEAAIQRDTDEASRLLEEENANIVRDLARMTERTATTERQVADLEWGATASESKGE